MRYKAMLVVLASAAAAACGDGTVGPGNGGNGQDIASRFEELADSVEGGGASPTADALRHAAEIVRLAGGATPVTLTVDGEDRGFEAVAEQLDFPQLECTGPDSSNAGAGGAPESGGNDTIPASPPGGECREVGTFSMRTLIAWEPENLAEVVRIVAYPGSTAVDSGVPDVMAKIPTDVADGSNGSDTVSTPGHPGFMGEYLVSDVGIWWAVEGTQSNELERVTGACTEDRVTFDWAEFSCEAASFRFEFAMRVESNDAESPSHDLSMASSSLAGVRLKVVSYRPIPPLPDPPPPPPPGNGPPPDSTVVLSP